jgi:hypothetical protein
MKIILILIFVTILVSGCLIGDGERDYAMSHITPTVSQSSPITPAITPSTNFPISIYWIKIDPISDKQVGDKYKITAKTNLSVGKEVHFDTYPISFKPTGPNEFDIYKSVAVGSVKVNPGNDSINTISFEIDSIEFQPSKYIVQMEWVEQNVTATNVTSTASYLMLPKENLSQTK